MSIFACWLSRIAAFAAVILTFVTTAEANKIKMSSAPGYSTVATLGNGQKVTVDFWQTANPNCVVLDMKNSRKSYHVSLSASVDRSVDALFDGSRTIAIFDREGRRVIGFEFGPLDGRLQGLIAVGRGRGYTNDVTRPQPTPRSQGWQASTMAGTALGTGPRPKPLTSEQKLAALEKRLAKLEAEQRAAKAKEKEESSDLGECPADDEGGHTDGDETGTGSTAGNEFTFPGI